MNILGDQQKHTKTMVEAAKVVMSSTFLCGFHQAVVTMFWTSLATDFHGSWVQSCGSVAWPTFEAWILNRSWFMAKHGFMFQNFKPLSC
jgi:hypothetical protein